MSPGLDAARIAISAVFLHKPIALCPRNVLQKVMENDILVSHGVDPFSCPVDSQTPGTEQNQCRALIQAQSVPDSRGLDPRIHPSPPYPPPLAGEGREGDGSRGDESAPIVRLPRGSGYFASAALADSIRDCSVNRSTARSNAARSAGSMASNRRRANSSALGARSR